MTLVHLLLVGCAAGSYGLLEAGAALPKAIRAGAPRRPVVAQHTHAARRRHVRLTSSSGTADLVWVLVATVVLAAVGAVRDICALAALPRLVVQALAVGVVIMTLPDEMRIVSALPWWLERGLLLLGGV